MLGYKYMMTYYRIMRSVRSYMDLGPLQQRKYLEKIAFLNPPPSGTKVVKLELGGVSCEQVRLGEQKDGKAIFFIHGGAFAFGSSRTHRNMVAYISRLTSYPVYSVDYRLTPENMYPIALEDCYDAFVHLAEKFGPENIILAGASAGGNLCAALVHYLQEKGNSGPSGICLLSAWLDLRKNSKAAEINNDKDSVFDNEDLREYANFYCSPEELNSPFVSPLAGDLSYFPPTLIQVAKNELLFPDSDEFRKKLEAADVRVTFEPSENLYHAWQLYPSFLEEAKEAIVRLASFVEGLEKENKTND